MAGEVRQESGRGARARLDLLQRVALGVVLLGFVEWLSIPALAQLRGSVIPWPIHGLLLALALSLPSELRSRLLLLATATMLSAKLLADVSIVGAVVATVAVLVQTIATLLIHERLSGGHSVASVRGAIQLLGAVALAALAMATFVVGAFFALIGPNPPSDLFLGWWAAALSSCVAITPVTITLLTPPVGFGLHPPTRHLERTVLLGLLALAVVDVFFGVGLPGVNLPVTLMMLPFLVWAALRFGPIGVAQAALIVMVGAITATVAGLGPFVPFSDDPILQLRNAEAYLAVVLGSAMLFSVAVAEREVAANRTAAALAQLRSILAGTGDLIAAVDRDLVILAVNPAWIAEFERISGTRVRQGMSMRDALAALPNEVENSLALWRRALDGERFVSTREFGDPARVREEFEITYGPVRDERGGIVGATQIVRNIAARRQQEQREAEARRLESVGRLAGGVAHDFNNLMTAVIGYSDLVARSLPPGDPRRPDLGEIERAARRAADLTQQLLAFAQRRIIEPRVVDPNALVQGMTRMLGRLIGAQVELDVRFGHDVWPIRVDPSQFEQVILNLALNARDAMPGGGTLLIEITNEEFTESLRKAPLPGIRLTVRDTGVGMSRDVVERVFEPFFTTKGLGQGTGLGLSTVHGIVLQAGGRISVESHPGRGTEFRLFFPRAVDQPPRSTPSAGLPMLGRSGGETILLVEDDAVLRGLAVRVLLAAGYSVLEAGDGRSALDVARRRTGPIDLLLADVILPHIGGRETADRLLVDRPAMRVLHISGYTDDEEITDGSLGREFLAKPFSADELLAAVRRALDGSPRDAPRTP